MFLVLRVVRDGFVLLGWGQGWYDPALEISPGCAYFRERNWYTKWYETRECSWVVIPKTVDFMPIYEYECPECGRFETIQKFSDEPLSSCPTCKEKGKNSPVTKAVSASAFHLKGSGWYKTDYAASGSTGKSSKAKGDSSSSSATTESAGSTETPAAPKACGTGCGCH